MVSALSQLGSCGFGDLEQDHQRDRAIALVHSVLSGFWRDRAFGPARLAGRATDHILVCFIGGWLLCRGHSLLRAQINAISLCAMAHMGELGRHLDVHRYLVRVFPLSRALGIVVFRLYFQLRIAFFKTPGINLKMRDRLH